ncbi:hypothetical protein U0070_017741 [Myodes glareolus]|uniref:Secreted protein n=1 Tax=Myodes glareolus TaxID=447135 RepID=A0AAW0HTM4_MYOGA
MYRMVLIVSFLGIGAEITLELLTREDCEESTDRVPDGRAACGPLGETYAHLAESDWTQNPWPSTSLEDGRMAPPSH